jgi:transposase
MARPYFLDLRERVVALVARGETCRSVAAVFDVSVASVVKWSKSRATGSAAAKAMGGKRPYLLEGERSFLLGRLAEKPDLTLHALLSELRERGVAVSCDTVWRFLRRTEAGFKKTLFASEQDRPDVARRRTLGKKIPLRLDPRRLVFIDETIDETWAILRQAQDQ